MNFDNIKRNYDKGLWTIDLVRVAVQKNVITAEQFQEITGQAYAGSSTSGETGTDAETADKAAAYDYIVNGGH